ncbi:PLU-1-like protein-domain-containing protein [Myxozyma melibiosi]|uniref:PLU-1-like protein-domain-containing protein n=1 Tax=Myxozyma melibiosi TaxID=54550 RepID=A0ABR1F8L9_9ASCO
MVPEYSYPSSEAFQPKLRMKAANGHGLAPVPLTDFGIPSVTSRQRPRALALDFDTVEGVADKSHKPPPKTDRVFGLQEAPTYYPSPEEFKDPFAYIKSISEEARQYGIVKIVPPDSWNPPFSLDTEKFWFKTRRQELNSMEGGTRANLNFLDQLHKFHKQRGITLTKLPSVDRRPLDLYHLKKSVDMRGGFVVVCKKKQWAEIGRELGYSGKIMTSLSSSLKTAYQKYVYPYELYLKSAKPLVQQQKEEEFGGPITPSKRQRTVSGTSIGDTPSLSPPGTPTDARSSAMKNGDRTSLSVESMLDMKTESEYSASGSSYSQAPDGELGEHGRHSKRIKRETPQDEQSATVVGSNMIMHRKTGVVKRLHDLASSRKPGENCEVCGRGDDAATMLLCDGCDNGYHMACLKPALKALPDYDWYCDKCLVGTGEFGFEEGQVYNLRQFQEKAKNFLDHYLSTRMPLNGKSKRATRVTEDEIEAEFWRLVESLDETVEVEYGADIHSTIHGSGFPTIERDPLDPYSTDPWNLNLLPLHEKSLFRHIKTDISGMTVPWLYVGMVFSTFCWHSEDHNTYSANYQHFGATKTWYGIPGDDADKFEDAMRKAVPELFEQQPDLLFQLVTMLSPKRLTEEGVRCYSIDQRPGEFVITFPQAYHSGFNHGFNFNEAVNFAPADWEPYGKLGVEIYQDYRKLPVFSHEELLLTAAERDHSIDTATWLGPALTSIKDQELNMRRHVQMIIPTIKVAKSPFKENDEVQCAYCNAFCYLSQIGCGCTSSVVCLNHYDELCDCKRSSRVLYINMPEETLEKIVSKVNERAALPQQWVEKYNKLFSGGEENKPSAKSLRSLLVESEKINYHIPETDQLRKIVEQANEWVEEAQSILARKVGYRRKIERTGSSSRRGSVKSGASSAAGEETEREVLHKPEYIDSLLQRIESMPFTSAEIDLLYERKSQIEEFVEHARETLANETNDADVYVALIETGYGLNVELEEVKALEVRLARLQWHERASDAGKTYIYLPDVKNILAEADRLEISQDRDELYSKLTKASTAGDKWEAEVNSQMRSGKPDYDLLDSMYDEASVTPVYKETYDRLGKFLIKHKEIEDAFVEFVEGCRSAEFSARPTYKDARKISEYLQDPASENPNSAEIRRYMQHVENWLSQGQALFFTAGTSGNSTLTSHLETAAKRTKNALSALDKPHTQQPTAEGEKRSSKELFCICRQPESGLMIECENCHEWYHNRCLKIPRGSLKDKEHYYCLLCDSRQVINRDYLRPTLEALEDWLKSASALGFIPEEFAHVKTLVEEAQRFRATLSPMIRPGHAYQAADIPILRFYLRKLEGSDVYLAEETQFLQRILNELASAAAAVDSRAGTGELTSTALDMPTKSQQYVTYNEYPPVYQSQPAEPGSGAGTMGDTRRMVVVDQVPRPSSLPVNQIPHQMQQQQQQQSAQSVQLPPLSSLLSGAPPPPPPPPSLTPPSMTSSVEPRLQINLPPPSHFGVHKAPSQLG